MSIIKSIKGLFGQTIHYKDGQKIGETWDSFIPGVKNHYDANGSLSGYSAKGWIADEVHYGKNGEYVGASYEGVFDSMHHYGAYGSHSVSTRGLTGTTTYASDDEDALLFSDPDFDSPSFGDSFDSDW